MSKLTQLFSVSILTRSINHDILYKCIPWFSAYMSTRNLSNNLLHKYLIQMPSSDANFLLSYWATSYSRGGVNQMWIPKSSKDLYIQSRSFSSCNSINTFDFSTIYTTIPHYKLQDRLRELDQHILFCKTKKQLWFYKKILWNWYHQHVRVIECQHMCYVWCACSFIRMRHISHIFLN